MHPIRPPLKPAITFTLEVEKIHLDHGVIASTVRMANEKTIETESR